MMYISTYKPCLQCVHHNLVLLCGGGQGARAGSPAVAGAVTSHLQSVPGLRPTVCSILLHTLLVISRAGNYPL